MFHKVVKEILGQSKGNILPDTAIHWKNEEAQEAIRERVKLKTFYKSVKKNKKNKAIGKIIYQTDIKKLVTESKS